MSGKLTITYEVEGDILYVDALEPYSGQEFEEIEQGVIARLNPHSGMIENLEILFFSKRIKQGKQLEFPLL